MKNNLLRSTLTLLALCAVAALPAAELPLREIAAVTPVNGDAVTIGTSRIMVTMRLGMPTYVLADGSWLYADYVATVADLSGTLVVRFAANKVCALSLADQATVTALRQAPRPVSSKQLLAVR